MVIVPSKNCFPNKCFTNWNANEAHFHLTAAANKQNCRYWAPAGDNSHLIEEQPLYDQRATVWKLTACIFSKEQSTLITT